MTFITDETSFTAGRSKRANWLFKGASIISIAWLVGVFAYVSFGMGWSALGYYLPHQLGAAIGGIFAPIALVWAVAIFMSKTDQMTANTDRLMQQLSKLAYDEGDAENQVFKITKSLRKQAETVREESDAAAKTLRTALDELSRFQFNLKEVVEQAAQTIRRSCEEVDTRSGRMNQALEDFDRKREAFGETAAHTTVSIEKAAGALEAKAEGVELRAQTVSENVNEAARVLEERGYSLSQSLQRQIDGMSVVADSLAENGEKISSNITRATGNIQDATRDAAGIAEQLEGMSEIAGAVEQRVTDATKRLSDSTSLLDGASSEIAARTEHVTEAADAIRARVDALYEATGKMGETIKATSTQATTSVETLNGKLTHQSEVMSNLFETVAAHANTEQEKMEAANKRFADAVRETVRDLSAAREELDSTAEHLDASSELAKASASRVAQTIGDAAGRAGAAADRVSHQIVQSTNLLDHKSQKLQAASNDLEARVQTVAAAQERQVEAIKAAGTQAVLTAEQIRDRLSASVRDLNAIVGEIQGQSNDVAAGIERRMKAVNEARTTLISATADTVERLETASKSISNAAHEHETVTEAVKAATEATAAEIDRTIRVGSESMLSVLSTLDTNRQALDDAVGESYSLLSQFVRQINAGTDDIQTVKDNFSNNLEGLLQKMGETKASVFRSADEADQRLTSIRSSLTDAAKDMRSLFESLHININEVYVTYEGKAQSIAELISTQTENIRIASEEIQSEFSRIGAYADGATSKVRQLSSTLENEQSELQVQISSLESKANSSVDKINAATQSLGEQANTVTTDMAERIGLLHTVIRDMGTGAADVRRTIHENTEVLRHDGQSLLNTLHEVSEISDRNHDKLQDLRSDVGETASNLTSFVGDIESKVQTAVVGLRGLSTETDGMIEDINKRLSESFDNLIDRAQVAQTNITAVQEMISEDGRKFSLSVDNTVQRAQEASANLSNEMRQVQGSAERLMKIVQQITSEHRMAERESFYAQSQKTLEFIESLEFDISRVFGDEIPHKVWSAYQAGDTRALTRRLLAMYDDGKLRSLPDLFQANHEFRKGVLSYIREMDRLLQQCDKADSSGLLRGAITSSDVGKLYAVLTEVIGYQNSTSSASSAAE